MSEVETAKPETKAAKQKVTTKYVVLTSESSEGPWSPLGNFDAHGQMAAKKHAAEKVGKETAESLYFIAIPASSYAPQKPALKVTTQIAFAD